MSKLPKLYFDFALNHEGKIIPISKVKQYVLDRFGIDCSVSLRDDGVILNVISFNSAKAICNAVKYSHDLMMYHGSNNLSYQIYIKLERKKPKEVVWSADGLFDGSDAHLLKQ